MGLDWVIILIIAALIFVPSVAYRRGFQTGFRTDYHAAAGARPLNRSRPELKRKASESTGNFSPGMPADTAKNTGGEGELRDRLLSK